MMRTVFLLPFALCVALAVHPVTAQSREPRSLTISHAGFEIISSGYLFADGPSGGGKSIVIAVFVSKTRQGKAPILNLSKRIEKFYSSEVIDGLAIVYFADRNAAENFPGSNSDEEAILKSIRGIYIIRNSQRRQFFKHSLSGMAESDFDSISVN